MTRARLINKLTPDRRYQAPDDTCLEPVRHGQYLFAATATNAGYFLLTDEDGHLQPLTVDVLGLLVRESRLYGVKLRNMRIFGAKGGMGRVPAGGRFYGVESLVVV